VLVRAASRDEARAAIEATQVIGNDLYPAAYRRRLMRVLLERVWSTLENE
jgi:CO/xanthine dehydrogenase FAD-binding subunit